MQILLLPATRYGVPPPLPSPVRPSISTRIPTFTRHFSSYPSLSRNTITLLGFNPKTTTFVPAASAGFTPPVDESDQAKHAQVAKRLEKTGRYFKRIGTFGFWGQLVCTIVAAVILSFSVLTTGKITTPASFYSTAVGIAAAFISVFQSFGYVRLSDRLRKTANDPSKAPPRADVIMGLRNGIIVNVLGIGAAILGLQATVGLLVGKGLTTSTTPFYQGVGPGSSPILALDVFLVQASANTITSHFLGLVSSLELLRSVTNPPHATPAAKAA
ncbi:protein TIC 21, chloroplastic-like [Silene latifolia]|uniref:protein TIC 21, chloroplastic-like n=1 Tax=Silene latifolia TaxID=37657 RepID=UPI003D770801